MIRAFKDFLIDYWKVCQESMKWLKKHWKGYIILCIVMFAITFIPIWLNDRKLKKRMEWLGDTPTMKIEDL